MESGRFRCKQRVLGIELGLAVERDRLDGGKLVHHHVGCAINAAARREDEALDAVALGDFDQHAGCGVVDFERGLLVLFAGRVADDGGEIDDGINATDRGNHVLNVAAIADAHLEVRMAEDAAKRFVTVNEAVNDAYFAAGFEKLANQAGADVAGAAEDENGAFGVGGAASADFITLLQQRFCEAREREADDRQHREEQKREARDQVGAEEEIVDGEQREDADAGAAHHDDHFVAADVGARACVEPVQ